MICTFCPLIWYYFIVAFVEPPAAN